MSAPQPSTPSPKSTARHCDPESSKGEAIQGSVPRRHLLDCFVAPDAPRNDDPRPSWLSRFSPALSLVGSLSLLIVAGLTSVSGCSGGGGGGALLPLPTPAPTFQCAKFTLTSPVEAVSPSKVTVFFALNDCNGSPIAGLPADDFKITEDDVTVSKFESFQRMASQSKGFKFHTLIALDMSGSVTNSGNLQNLQTESKKLIQEIINAGSVVSLYAFDGSASIKLLQEETANITALNTAIGNLTSFASTDPSTNLYGAVVDGIQKLELNVTGDVSGAPTVKGFFILFTDGTDQAARVLKQDAQTAVDNTKSEVFVIAVGAEIEQQTLQGFGKSGVSFANSNDQQGFQQAFTGITDKVKIESNRYYVLTYCSPKRAGTHTLKIVTVADPNGEPLSTTFDASSFTGGCTQSTLGQ